MKNNKTIHESASPIVAIHLSCVGGVMVVVKRVVEGLIKVITWLQKVTGPSGDI